MKKLSLLLAALLTCGAVAFAVPEDPDGGASENACTKSRSPIVSEYCN